ncbi:hypothetical protein ANN_17843 [Periplaneta americana]|uniref:Uncharacterized protein n=1 Tax=Periplaneta americana TaxID=6978 RepID=A0ABQ8SU23_PERAM|nr:hypothetical protein ANN_17843 [Periplaneta americana]
MNPGSSTENYPAFARIALRENPGKNLNQKLAYCSISRTSDFCKHKWCNTNTLLPIRKTGNAELREKWKHGKNIHIIAALSWLTSGRSSSGLVHNIRRTGMQNRAPVVAYVTSRITSFIHSLNPTAHSYDKSEFINSRRLTAKLGIPAIDPQSEYNDLRWPTTERGGTPAINPHSEYNHRKRERFCYQNLIIRNGRTQTDKNFRDSVSLVIFDGSSSKKCLVPNSEHCVVIKPCPLALWARESRNRAGELSEEAMESLNKTVRRFRQDRTRKTSRITTNFDLFHRLFLASDPLISNLRELPKKKRTQLPLQVLQLLSTPEGPNSEGSGDSDSEDE